jgi:galactokinase
MEGLVMDIGKLIINISIQPWFAELLSIVSEKLCEAVDKNEITIEQANEIIKETLSNGYRLGIQMTQGRGG